MFQVGAKRGTAQGHLNHHSNDAHILRCVRCASFQMFTLGRPDVLPTTDLGVRRGMQLLHGLKVSEGILIIHQPLQASGAPLM